MTELEQQLAALVHTALRETSPASAPAFDVEKDLSRLHFYLRTRMEELGFDYGTTGGPAVLKTPDAPEQLSVGEQEAWLTGWRSGYAMAWRPPAIILTDTES